MRTIILRFRVQIDLRDFPFDFEFSRGIECRGIFLPTLESRAMLNVTRNFKQIESTSHVMRPGTDLLARPFA